MAAMESNVEMSESLKLYNSVCFKIKVSLSVSQLPNIIAECRRIMASVILALAVLAVVVKTSGVKWNHHHSSTETPPPSPPAVLAQPS